MTTVPLFIFVGLGASGALLFLRAGEMIELRDHQGSVVLAQIASRLERLQEDGNSSGLSRLAMRKIGTELDVMGRTLDGNVLDCVQIRQRGIAVMGWPYAGCLDTEKHDDTGTTVKLDGLVNGYSVIGVLATLPLFDTLAKEARSLVFFVLLAVSLGAMSVYVGYRVALARPLSQIAALTEALANIAQISKHMAHGHRHARIGADNLSQDPEIRSVAIAFDDMADKINHQEDALKLALEQAMADVKAKNHFLALVSHEIRTPVNAVSGMLREIEYRNEDESLIGMLRTAGTAIRSLTHLVGQLIDVSRLNADEMSVDLSRFAIAQMVREALSVVEGNFHNIKNLCVILNLNDLDDIYVNSDREKLKQVVINIIANAFKYTGDDGQIKVEAVLSSTHAGKSQFGLTVTDNGVGIPPEAIDQIFEPYFQSEKRDGLGLGLAICRQIVQAMGGDIGVRSELGVGSVFSFSVPISVARMRGDDAKGPCGDQVERISIPENLLSGYHMLVIEDNLANQRVMRLFLERHGATLEVASNGHDAIEMALTASHDLIISDINLPDLDGVYVITKVRETLGDHMPPVIGLTADAMPRNITQYLGSGMVSCLIKPFLEGELLKAILTALRADVDLDLDRLIMAETESMTSPREELSHTQKRAVDGMIAKLDQEFDGEEDMS